MNRLSPPSRHTKYLQPRNFCSETATHFLPAHDIQSGSCEVMVGRSNGWNDPSSGVHLSSVSGKNPSWVTMTSIGYRNLDCLNNGQSAPLLFSELSLTDADPDNPPTCSPAHTRTLGKSASPGSSYRGACFGEPHAEMSPSGSRILFNSDWYDSGSVDTCVVDLGVPPAVDSAIAEQAIRAVAVDEFDLVSDTKTDTTRSAVCRLQPLVRTEKWPARVYANFVDSNQGRSDRVSIARAGSPDSQLLMWLYTNGTQELGGRGPDNGQLDFLQQYLGNGNFEARLRRLTIWHCCFGNALICSASIG